MTCQFKSSHKYFKNLQNTLDNQQKNYLMNKNLLYMAYINRQLSEIVIPLKHLLLISLVKVNGMRGIRI